MTYNSIETLVGNTPLVRLQRLAGDTSNTLLVKLEGTNPGGSVKDRAALSMIKHAEASGKIKPGDSLIEATSGNTGIALAMVAAIRGYKMKLLMPESMSEERRASMKAYGAEIISVSAEIGIEGARDLALEMQDRGEGLVLNQFANVLKDKGVKNILEIEILTNQFVNLVISALMVFLQAGIIISIFEEYKNNELKSFLPAWLFVLLLHLHPDLLYISPQLLSFTFVLLAFKKLIVFAENNNKTKIITSFFTVEI